MSIKNEIMRLKAECENRISETQMELSFGEDYLTRFIRDKYKPNNWKFLFQEDGKIYLISVELLRLGVYQFTDRPMEVSDDDFEEFFWLKEVYESQIKLFNEIFEHPKFRLKTIFK